MVEETVKIAVILGVTEAFKRAFSIPKKLVPLLSLFFGVLLSCGLKGFNAESVYLGLIYGLSASGLYSQTKTFVGWRNKKGRLG